MTRERLRMNSLPHWSHTTFNCVPFNSSIQSTLLTLRYSARFCANSSGLGMMQYFCSAITLLVIKPCDVYRCATTCIGICLCSFVSILSTSNVGVTASPYSSNSSGDNPTSPEYLLSQCSFRQLTPCFLSHSVPHE